MTRGMRKGNWSSQELERLRILYPQSGERHVSRLLRRSAASVRRKTTELFRRKNTRGDWSPKEEHQLRLSYGVLNLRALCLVLARSRRDVSERIRILRQERRGPWTRSDELLLKRIYPNRSDEDLEVCMSRSRRQIARMARRFCLAKDKKFTAQGGSLAVACRTTMPRWGASEVIRLQELYTDRDNLEIARAFGRSVASVANKASQMGLKKSRNVLAEIGRQNVKHRYSDGPIPSENHP